MNKRGASIVLGFALLTAAFVFMIAAFATIDPFKETLDDARNTDALNCPGTTDFNGTTYQNDSNLNRLVRRPTCFVTGISMVYFIGAFLIGIIAWVFRNWVKIK